MLVLSRRLHEALIVDDNIEIVVLGIKGNRVQLGIKAPDSVRIWREEQSAPVRAKAPRIVEVEIPATEEPLVIA